MDTNMLMNMMSMFNKNKSQNNPPQNISNPSQEKLLKEIEKNYPYDDFPYRFTKNGQERLKEKKDPVTSKKDISTDNINNSNSLNTNNNKNGMNFNLIKNLLPLFNKNNSMDIGSLLGTLNKDSNSQNNDNNVSDLANILSALKPTTNNENKKERQVNENFSNETKPFDSYERY